jgi:SNF2 family DNA or RNA helicase
MAPLKRHIGDKVLHQHQVAAVQWMIGREKDAAYSGGFLCDEMGLGKTVSILGLFANKPVRRTLILGPLSVLRQWRRALVEADMAAYELEKGEWRFKGGAPFRGRFYLTNYDKLLGSHEPFLEPFNRLVCDEAHILRNGQSRKVKKLAQVTAQHKWFLTGTPLVNRLTDFYTLLGLLNKHHGPHNETNALDKMEVLALHRTQEDLRTHLGSSLPPPPKVNIHRIEFTTEAEAKFYRGIQGRLQEELEGLLAQDHMNRALFLTLLLRLRQISSHPQTYIQGMRRLHGNGYHRQDWSGDSSKVTRLLDVMRAEKYPCGFVIMCHFKEEMEILRARLESETELVEDVFTYSGDLSASQRADVIDECEASMKRLESIPRSRELVEAAAPHLPQLPSDVYRYVIDPFLGAKHTVLLAQIQCAGTGLNLQFMNRVVFLTPWWTAALMDQAIGRVVRLGQRKKTEIHHLCLAEEMEISLNIDDYMNERVEAKRTLCQRLLAAADHTILAQ